MWEQYSFGLPTPFFFFESGRVAAEDGTPSLTHVGKHSTTELHLQPPYNFLI
jgi:hypothetical protein